VRVGHNVFAFLRYLAVVLPRVVNVGERAVEDNETYCEHKEEYNN
jgi:hypothetical protein